jgi:hypothetical protein
MIRKTFPMALTSTLQTIYTVPAGKRAEIVLVFVSNTSGSNGSFKMNIYNDATATTLPAFDAYTVTSKQYFEIGGEPNQYVALSEGDYVQVSATQAMTCLLNVIEHNDVIKGG